MATIRAALTTRAVHVKIEPRPRNIRESREVLRVMKSFGEVASFRNLRYDPIERGANTILAIYQRPEAASKLIAASPFNFTIEPPPPSRPVTSPASLGLLQGMGNFPPSIEKPAENSNILSEGASIDPTPNDLDHRPREFHLTADVSLMDHQGYIQRKPYYWGYQNNNRSFAQEDLAKSVPLEGMSVIDMHGTEVPNRIVLKKLREVAQRKTLRQMWEEGNQSTGRNLKRHDISTDISAQRIMMKILIFGTGGIGSVYVYVLHKAGADVTTVCRSNYDAITEQGITINSKIFGDVHVKPKAVQDISNAEGPWEYIVICSKAMPGSSPSTASLIQPAVGSSTTIVLIQNGIDIESEYAHAFPKNTIISGVAYLPVTQVKPGIVSMGNLELLELGTFPHDASNVSKDKVEQFAQSIRAGGATAKVYNDIQARRWSKLVLNARWNPICALSRLGDKNFLKLSPEAAGIVRTVMLEVVSVAEALGYKEVNTETVDNHLNRVKARLEPRGVEPSMLTDVRSNRPLEVEAILGNTVRIARKKGINTPMLEMLYILAKGLSQSITMSQSV